MIPTWLEIALEELGAGVAEVPGPGDNPVIGAYLAEVGLAPEDETPWCSAFAGHCMKAAGRKGTGSAAARSWLTWGVASEPRLGAVTVLWRDHPGSAHGHVGFLLDHDATGIYLLGGNQGDRVSVARFPIDRVLGYRMPARVI